MSRFANCNYQVLQIRSGYKQRLEQWRSTSLKLGIAKIPEQTLSIIIGLSKFLLRQGSKAII